MSYSRDWTHFRFHLVSISCTCGRGSLHCHSLAVSSPVSGRQVVHFFSALRRSLAKPIGHLVFLERQKAHQLNLTRSQMYNFQLSFSLSPWFSPGPLPLLSLSPPWLSCSLTSASFLLSLWKHCTFGKYAFLSLNFSTHIYTIYTPTDDFTCCYSLLLSRACICIFGYFYLFQFFNVVIALYSDTPSSPLNPFFFLSVVPSVQSSPTTLSLPFTLPSI